MWASGASVVFVTGSVSHIDSGFVTPVRFTVKTARTWCGLVVQV